MGRVLETPEPGYPHSYTVALVLLSWPHWIQNRLHTQQSKSLEKSAEVQFFPTLCTTVRIPSYLMHLWLANRHKKVTIEVSKWINSIKMCKTFYKDFPKLEFNLYFPLGILVYKTTKPETLYKTYIVNIYIYVWN